MYLLADPASDSVLAESGAIFVVTTPDLSKTKLNATLLQSKIQLVENGKERIPGGDILRVEFPYVNGSGARYLPDGECLGGDEREVANVIRNLENKLPRFSLKEFENEGFIMEVHAFTDRYR